MIRSLQLRLCLRGVFVEEKKCKWEENVNGEGVNLSLYKFLHEKNKAHFTDAPFDYGLQLTAGLKLVKALSYRKRSKLNWIFIQTYVRS